MQSIDSIAYVDLFCIAQTQRNLAKRREEHQSSPNSEIYSYLQFNLSHKVDFHNLQVLISCPDKHKLLILESPYIQLLKPISTSTPHLIHSAFLMLKRYRPVFIFHFNHYQDVIHVSFCFWLQIAPEEG